MLPVGADLQRIQIEPAFFAERCPHGSDGRGIQRGGEWLPQDLFDTHGEMVADVLAHLRDR
jgi:hypothetical protein